VSRNVGVWTMVDDTRHGSDLHGDGLHESSLHAVGLHGGRLHGGRSDRDGYTAGPWLLHVDGRWGTTHDNGQQRACRDGDAHCRPYLINLA